MEPPPPEKMVEHFYHNETSGEYYYGYCIDLIWEISQTMNFNFVVFEPPDGMYGTMQVDGSWNGMVKELIEDVSILPTAGVLDLIKLKKLILVLG